MRAAVRHSHIAFRLFFANLQDGQKRVRILDRWYDVRCAVRTIHGLSAHADGDELLRFLKPTLAVQTAAFVVHECPRTVVRGVIHDQ